MLLILCHGDDGNFCHSSEIYSSKEKISSKIHGTETRAGLNERSVSVLASWY